MSIHPFILRHRRKWEKYSHSIGVDASCGAAGVLLRLLAIPLPQGVCAQRQERIKQDATLQSKSTDELLDLSIMPDHLRHMMVSQGDCVDRKGRVFLRFFSRSSYDM